MTAAGEGCEPPPAPIRESTGDPLWRAQRAAQLLLDHQNLLTLLVNERFFSTILQLKIGGESQAAIVKDVQRHPAKNQILHMDLQRVLENEQIRMEIPLHFKGGAAAPGVKTQGGVVYINDEATTESNIPVNINILSNDKDPDGDKLSVMAVSRPHKGTIESEF